MDLLSPNLLTRDELLCIIDERQLNLEINLKDLSKDKLLDIYKTYLIPKARRDTKLNNKDQVKRVTPELLEKMEFSDTSSNESLERKMVNVRLNRPDEQRKRNANSSSVADSKRSKITWP